MCINRMKLFAQMYGWIDISIALKSGNEGIIGKPYIHLILGSLNLYCSQLISHLRRNSHSTSESQEDKSKSWGTTFISQFHCCVLTANFFSFIWNRSQSEHVRQAAKSGQSAVKYSLNWESFLFYPFEIGMTGSKKVEKHWLKFLLCYTKDLSVNI